MKNRCGRFDVVLARRCAAPLLFLGAIVAAPWLPAATYLPAALAGISFAIGQYITIRRQVSAPMVHAWFVCVFFMVVTIAVSRTVLTGGLVVLFFPLSGACAGFPTKLVRLCVAFMATLSIGAALLTYNSSAVRNPIEGGEVTAGAGEVARLKALLALDVVRDADG
jgi:hypothetical protein